MSEYQDPSYALFFPEYEGDFLLTHNVGNTTKTSAITQWWNHPHSQLYVQVSPIWWYVPTWVYQVSREQQLSVSLGYKYELILQQLRVGRLMKDDFWLAYTHHVI